MQKINNRSRPCNTPRHNCIVLIQGNEKSLMKIAVVSIESLKTVTCLPKILFNIDITDLCLLPCTPLFLRLETSTKQVMPKLDLANLKIPEPIDE